MLWSSAGKATLIRFVCDWLNHKHRVWGKDDLNLPMVQSLEFTPQILLKSRIAGIY
jgi:hypothetical protein